jgi:parallel beta-helix repeat protein
VAYGSAEAGIYIGDSEDAAARVEENEVYDNGIGIFVRDAANGRVDDNEVHDNCVGILLLNTGAPTDSAGWRVDDNDVERNNEVCPASDEGPPFSGIGLALGGASANRIDHNDIDGNAPAGTSFASGGVVLFPTVDEGGAVPSDNRIDHNDFGDNQPYDIDDQGTGTGNVFDDNECDASQPPGLCGDDAPGPAGDSLVGSGHVLATTFALDVHAGPGGEDPSGTLTLSGFLTFTATPNVRECGRQQRGLRIPHRHGPAGGAGALGLGRRRRTAGWRAARRLHRLQRPPASAAQHMPGSRRASATELLQHGWRTPDGG